MIEADKLGQLRTGAASGVAAKHLAREGAATLGVIGCGWQARAQVACIRAALPAIERVVAYCRTEERLHEFCARGRRRARREPPRRRPRRTSSSRSRPRATRCCAASGCGRARSSARSARTTRAARELDNVVLERAAFVCCDSLEDAKLESGDLIEPVEAGVLDWLEVHELQEVVAGELPGRAGGRRHRRLQVERARRVGRRRRRGRARARARARRRARALARAARGSRRPCRRRARGSPRAGRAGARPRCGVSAVRDVAGRRGSRRATRPRSCSRIT